MLDRIVKCPRCQKPTAFSSKNRYRPFCSERCRLIDLGEWASGRYAIPAEESPSNAQSDNQDRTNSDDPHKHEEDP